MSSSFSSSGSVFMLSTPSFSSTTALAWESARVIAFVLILISLFPSYRVLLFAPFFLSFFVGYLLPLFGISTGSVTKAATFSSAAYDESSIVFSLLYYSNLAFITLRLSFVFLLNSAKRSFFS